MSDWLKANWLTLASAALTLAVGLNAAFGWVPAEAVALVVAIAGTYGVHVLRASDQAAVRAAADALAVADTAHDRIDGMFEVAETPPMPLRLRRNDSGGWDDPPAS